LTALLPAQLRALLIEHKQQYTQEYGKEKLLDALVGCKIAWVSVLQAIRRLQNANVSSLGLHFQCATDSSQSNRSPDGLCDLADHMCSKWHEETGFRQAVDGDDAEDDEETDWLTESEFSDEDEAEWTTAKPGEKSHWLWRENQARKSAGRESLSFSPGQARVYLVLPHQGRESPMKLGRIAHVSLMRGNCLFELCLQRFTMHLTNINRSGHSAVIFMVYLMCIDVEASYSSMPVTTHGSHDFYWQFLEAAQQTQITGTEARSNQTFPPLTSWHRLYLKH